MLATKRLTKMMRLHLKFQNGTGEMGTFSNEAQVSTDDDHPTSVLHTVKN